MLGKNFSTEMVTVYILLFYFSDFMEDAFLCL